MSYLNYTISTVLLSLLVFLPLNTMATVMDNNSLEGIWRGELLMQKGVSLTIGVKIDKHHTELLLSSPHQNMYGRKPSAFSITDNKLSFQDEEHGVSFIGNINNNKIVGTFTQGKKRALTLHKLEVNDLERMKFEGKYAGNLIINASSSLPLVLHVAVLKNGYSAALDSPAQNSRGIPIDKVDIDDSQLTFTAKALKAKFSGKKGQDGYRGSFIQGLPMDLTLTKISKESEHIGFKAPEFGEKGGAVALINNDDVQTRYFGEDTTQTQYEIGSLTKTMTAYLLAKQVVNNKLALTTTIDKMFANSPAISIKSLATHTSGLERNPPSIHNTMNIDNPFAHVSRQDLVDDLAKFDVQNKTSVHAYSNFAYAVLGEALAINKQSTLSDELNTGIFKPLKMTNSYLADTVNKRGKNLSEGYNAVGKPVSVWDFSAVSGAGAVVSTLDNMIEYAKHMMHESSNITALSQLLLSSYTHAGPCCDQGLAWLIMKDKQGKKYAWHNGMTNGFSAFLGFYLDGSRALVMLNKQAISYDNTAHLILTGDKGLNSI